ncbi:MAG: alpha/beta fold hydrolase [Candidatus Dormibacteraceae bacterium]
MRQPTESWAERSGISLHCLEWTPEAEVVQPAILFLHGLSSNAGYWERVAEHLTHRRLVALDQRGHGLTGRQPHSPTLPDGYAMKELVDDAAFVISELNLDTPVVVGHSWGATVALELVGTRAGIASGLVFIDGPVQSAANLFSWEDAQRIMQPPLPRFAKFAEAVEESKRDFEGAWADDLESFVRARIVEDGDHLVLTLTGPVRFELLKGLYESQPDILWPAVDVPAAALLALRSFARISRSTDAGANRLREIAPFVEIKWFDTPHDIPLFMPGAVAAEIDKIAKLAAANPRSEAPAG